MYSLHDDKKDVTVKTIIESGRYDITTIIKHTACTYIYVLYAPGIIIPSHLNARITMLKKFIFKFISKYIVGSISIKHNQILLI